jgi:Exopolyphosphatase-related proteins
MTLDGMAEYLRDHDDYVLLSHDGPDADGLGAAYSLAIALGAIGKSAFIATSGQIPAKFRFIDQRGIIHGLVPGAVWEALPFSAEAITPIVVDTHDTAYLGSSSALIIEKVGFSLFIDHHELRRTAQRLELLDPSASSSCELVYLLARRLGAAIPLDAAEALYAGIIYDTGSFAYPKTSESTFACALELVRLGVKPYEMHKKLYESASNGSLLLQKAVLSSLVLALGGRVAIQRLLKEELEASGASYEDAEDLVNLPLQDKKVEVSILFKENLEGRLRCSMRSKGEVNVASVAQSFGGGGHRTAAGFTCASPLALAEEAVLKNIAQAMSSN